MDRRCALAVGRADNAKLHHVLVFGLSNALLRWIKANEPLEGFWTSRFDVVGAGDVREVGILPLQLNVWARR